MASRGRRRARAGSTGADSTTTCCRPTASASTPAPTSSADPVGCHAGGASRCAPSTAPANSPTSRSATSTARAPSKYSNPTPQHGIAPGGHVPAWTPHRRAARRVTEGVFDGLVVAQAGYRVGCAHLHLVDRAGAGSPVADADPRARRRRPDRARPRRRPGWPRRDRAASASSSATPRCTSSASPTTRTSPRSTLTRRTCHGTTTSNPTRSQTQSASIRRGPERSSIAPPSWTEAASTRASRSSTSAETEFSTDEARPAATSSPAVRSSNATTSTLRRTTSGWWYDSDTARVQTPHGERFHRAGHQRRRSIDPTATIDPTARIESGATVGPHARSAPTRTSAVTPPSAASPSSATAPGSAPTPNSVNTAGSPTGPPSNRTASSATTPPSVPDHASPRAARSSPTHASGPAPQQAAARPVAPRAAPTSPTPSRTSCASTASSTPPGSTPGAGGRRRRCALPLGSVDSTLVIGQSGRVLVSGHGDDSSDGGIQFRVRAPLDGERTHRGMEQ